VKAYRVVFAPEAVAQLEALYDYVAQATSSDVADGYTSAIVSYCEALHISPLRGARRDDIRPGLRITNYRKRAVIAFAVGDAVVSILGEGREDLSTAAVDRLSGSLQVDIAKARSLLGVAGGC
jgi:toxin ParE1/3/4